MQATLRTSCVIALALLGQLIATPETCAQEPAEVPAEAGSVEALYEAGKAALRAKKPAEAVKHFKTALARSDGRAVITWQMLLAVAVAYKELGYPVHTLEYFQRFVDITAPHQEVASEKWQRRHTKARQDVAELEKALAMTYGFVTVTSSPPGARVTVDGRPAGADEDAVTPFRLILTPGPHALVLTLDGHETAERQLAVSAGEPATTEVTLTLATPAAPAVAAPAQPAPSMAADETVMAISAADTSRSTLGPWLVISTGGAAAVVGVAMAVLATQEEDAMNKMETEGSPDSIAGARDFADEWRDREDSLETYNIVSGVMFGVGAAAVTGGLLWLLLDGPADAPDQAAGNLPTVTMTPTEGGLFSHATWRF